MPTYHFANLGWASLAGGFARTSSDVAGRRRVGGGDLRPRRVALPRHRAAGPRVSRRPAVRAAPTAPPGPAARRRLAAGLPGGRPRLRRDPADQHPHDRGRSGLGRRWRSLGAVLFIAILTVNTQVPDESGFFGFPRAGDSDRRPAGPHSSSRRLAVLALIAIAVVDQPPPPGRRLVRVLLLRLDGRQHGPERPGRRRADGRRRGGGRPDLQSPPRRRRRRDHPGPVGDDHRLHGLQRDRRPADEPRPRRGTPRARPDGRHRGASADRPRPPRHARPQPVGDRAEERAGRRRLVDDDPARARSEMEDVQRVARESLSAVRETIGGYRQPSLATELAGARSALAAAGIDGRVEPAPDGPAAGGRRGPRLGGPRGRDEHPPPRPRRGGRDPRPDGADVGGGRDLERPSADDGGRRAGRGVAGRPTPDDRSRRRPASSGSATGSPRSAARSRPAGSRTAASGSACQVPLG